MLGDGDATLISLTEPLETTHRPPGELLVLRVPRPILATRLAKGPGLAISASKVAINNYMRMISNLVLPLSLSMEDRTLASHDHREAVKAFQEKRAADFTGR